MHPHPLALRSPGFLLLISLCLAHIAPLHAQDVTVTPPQWYDAANVSGEQPPRFKHAPKVTYPEELRKTDEQGYVLMGEVVTTDGRGPAFFQGTTHPYFLTALETLGDQFKMLPATSGGKPVEAFCWYAVIFNPASAKKSGPDARPRLLAVAPAIIPREMFGKTSPVQPPLVWTTIKLDERGEVQAVTPEANTDERMVAAVHESVKAWRFAPARRGGVAVASELRVPFLATSRLTPHFTQKSSPPKAIKRVEPVYPLSMRATGFRGSVVVEFTVRTDGSVGNASIVRSDNPAFDEPALDAVRQWQFKAATQNGMPVKTRLQQPISFALAGAPDGGNDAYAVRGRTDQSKLPPGLQFDTPAKVRGTIVPVYPYELRRDGVRGKVRAGIVIDESGRVVRVQIIEATKPEFAMALTAALEMFTFEPALKGGKPIPSLLRFDQEFNFTEFAEPEADSLLRQEKKHPEKIYSAAALDAPLKPSARRSPIFPTALLGKTEKGEATIEVLVDEEGRVRLPRIVTASDPAFGYAAVQALKQWRFEIPKVHGKPAVVRVRAPFKFLRSESAIVTEQQPAAK